MINLNENMSPATVVLSKQPLWRWPKPLVRAVFIRRFARFFVEAEDLSTGEIILAHCPNTGKMTSCVEPGQEILLSIAEGKTRKLPYTWELAKTELGYVVVNTQRANLFTQIALEHKLLNSFLPYSGFFREIKYGQGTRFDFGLIRDSQNERENVSHFLEVKAVTLFQSPQVSFPDAPSVRAKKHLHELMSAAQKGYKASLLFMIMRPEGEYFAPADEVDQDYGELLRQGKDEGVELLSYRALVDLQGFYGVVKVPINLSKNKGYKK